MMAGGSCRCSPAACSDLTALAVMGPDGGTLMYMHGNSGAPETARQLASTHTPHEPAIPHSRQPMSGTGAPGLQSERSMARDAAMPTLSVGEAVTRSGLSVRTIHRAIQSGELPVEQVGGKVGWEYRIRPCDLDSFVRAHRVGDAHPLYG